MYAPSYGYAPGNASAPFTPNGVSPVAQPHNPHQQQPSQQQPQHMMYNQQQYASAGGQQSPYGPSANGMGGNAGAMGMMQNNGMAHMAGGHVSPYQTPYSGSPYGTIPTSTAANLPPNFMPPTSNASAFQMNPNMNLQHQVQRMQPPSTSSTPQPGLRAPPFAGGQQNTPPPSQPQFSTSQNAAHLQATSNNQQVQVVTPQTPTFPSGSQNASSSNLATPLSPSSEQREKERVTLLLELNNKLLQEVMRLQAAHNEKKDESALNSALTDGLEKDKEKVTKPPASRDYFECMRRLQCNLAYLAAIADRSHKPSSQIPAHPQIMSAPPLAPKNSQPKSPSTNAGLSSDGTKREELEDKKNYTEDAEEDRGEVMRDLYKKLQALFPGVDLKRETPMPGALNAAQRAQLQAAQKQQSQQSGGQVGGAGNEQQKMQNELLRQKMMQAQQNQNQNAAQQGQTGGR